MCSQFMNASAPTIMEIRQNRVCRLVAVLSVFLSGACAAERPASDQGQKAGKDLVAKLARDGLERGQAFPMLHALCTEVGHRLTASPGAEKAVAWCKKMMEECGLERVRLEPVEVPRWVRGEHESAVLLPAEEGSTAEIPLKVTALGGSIGTPAEGITAEVLEVRSFEELRAAGDKARGKIIFFNRAFERGHFNTFHAYGGAVNQRGQGAIEAAKAGGVAALVRSMTSRIDDQPHTGMMRYADGVTRLPAAALSTIAADRLSSTLAKAPQRKLTLKLSCQSLGRVMSANVIGELVGRELPNEVVVLSGHLDSWDKGQGAHDDGAGCIQAIEALRLLKSLGLHPKRTLRVVLFMNEENGNEGEISYAATDRPGETLVAAISSDSGGFAPRGFDVGGGSKVYDVVSKWAPYFAVIDADQFRGPNSGGSPITGKGAAGFLLFVDTHRYFDYHHSDNDTIDKVNERELELGAVAMAGLAYLLAEEGVPRAAAPASATAR